MFTGEREAQRFSEFLRAHHTGKLVPSYQESKLEARRVAAAAGVRTPELYRTFDDIEAVDLSGLPDRFVLKPNRMASSHGVYLLVRQGPDQYWNMLSGTTVNTARIKADTLAAFNRAGRDTGQPILAEELVVGENGPDEIPYDYKAWMFAGEPRFIMQIDRNTRPTSVACFRGNFEPLPEYLVRLTLKRQYRVGLRPQNWEAVLGAARTIAAQIDDAFIGIDLYTSGREVVLGEITKSPGPPYFGLYMLSPELDGEMGAYWRLAMEKRGEPIPVISGKIPAVRRLERIGQRPLRELKGSLSWRITAPLRRAAKLAQRLVGRT